MSEGRLSAYQLWEKAGGGTAAYDRDEYIRLMWQHGHLIEGKKESLPCGWSPTKKEEE